MIECTKSHRPAIPPHGAIVENAANRGVSNKERAMRMASFIILALTAGIGACDGPQPEAVPPPPPPRVNIGLQGPGQCGDGVVDQIPGGRAEQCDCTHGDGDPLPANCDRPNGHPGGFCTADCTTISAWVGHTPCRPVTPEAVADCQRAMRGMHAAFSAENEAWLAMCNAGQVWVPPDGCEAAAEVRRRQLAANLAGDLAFCGREVRPASCP